MKQRFRIYFSDGEPVFFNIDGNFFIHLDNYNLYGIYKKPEIKLETESQNLFIDGDTISRLYIHNWIFA